MVSGDIHERNGTFSVSIFASSGTISTCCCLSFVLDPADDAAIAGWGESWQIPSVEDYDELIAECTWTWQEGYEGTDIDGFLIENNGNSIFLPAAGYVFDFGSASGDNYCGYYFTTSVASSPSDCITLYFVNGDEKGTMNHSEGRYCGFPIRPVWKD